MLWWGNTSNSWQFSSVLTEFLDVHYNPPPLPGSCHIHTACNASAICITNFSNWVLFTGDRKKAHTWMKFASS